MIKSKDSLLRHSFIKATMTKCQHVKSMISTTLSRKKKQTTNQHYYGNQKTEASPTVETNCDKQDNTTILSRYPTAVRGRYEEDDDDDDRNSLTSTFFLPDEDDCYSSNSSVVSEENALREEEQQQYPHLNVYSNLYEKLPNGNWLVSYRTRDEKILSTHEIKSYVI